MRSRTRFLALESPEGGVARLAARFESWGCTSLVGLGPDEFAREVARGGADIVLVDASRPRALEAVRDLTGTRGRRTAALVAVTESRTGAVAAQALALGADDVFALPMSDALLAARIRALAGLVRLQGEVERRTAVLQAYLTTLYGDAGTTLRQDTAGILLVGSASGEQVQLVTALSGRITVTYAESPARALEQLRRQRFDSVILSSIVEEGAPARFCRELRADPHLQDLPILVALPPHAPIASDAPFAWGASDVFVQPIHPEILRLRVEGWVRQQRLRGGLRASFDGRHPLPVGDQLTGLYGHGFLHAYLDHLIDAAGDGAAPIAVAAFGLEGTHRINRSFGYAMGDRALAVAAAVIARSVRADDVPARLGGDVFVVVLDDMDEAGAARVALRVAEAVAATPVVAAGDGPRLRLATAIARLRPGDGAAELVKRALARLGSASLREAS